MPSCCSHGPVSVPPSPRSPAPRRDRHQVAPRDWHAVCDGAAAAATGAMAGGSDEAAAAAGSLVNPNEMRFGSGPPPVVRYAAEARVKKGEDFYLIEPPRQHSSPPYGVFCVFDGHNGMGAALYTKEKIMEAVTEHMPEEVDPDEWLRALPLALAEAFLHLHNDFVATGGQSGTMCTAAVVAGWTVTVAAVGDSRAILDTAGGGVVALSGRPCDEGRRAYCAVAHFQRQRGRPPQELAGRPVHVPLDRGRGLWAPHHAAASCQADPGAEVWRPLDHGI